MAGPDSNAAEAAVLPPNLPPDLVTRRERTRRIILLVVTLLIGLTGGGLGFYYSSERDKLAGPGGPIPRQREEVRVQRNKNAALVEAWIRFGEPIGFRSAAHVLRPEAVPSPVNERVVRDFLNRWRARLNDEYKIAGYKDWGVGAANECLDVQKLFREVRQLREKSRAAEEDAVKESGARLEEPDYKIPAGTVSEKHLQGYRAGDEALRARAQAVAASRAGLDTTATELTKRIREIKTQIKTFETVRLDEERKKSEEENANIQEKKKALEEKKRLQDRLDWIELNKQKALEEQEADGRVIHSDAEHGVVYIDIRQVDGLFKGTKFKVFSLHKNGVKKMKGEVQVIDVRPDYSRCAILRTLHPGDVMETDDYVFDEFYDRNKELEFAFAGHFVGKYSNDEMARKLREFPRYRFSPKVTQETNYLVAGEDYEKHPNYAEAIELGIKIIREKDFYAFLGIGE